MTDVPRIVLWPRAAQPEVPWRNGGGTTREVAAWPPGARASDPFLWRVSVAQVATDGPFSLFPGIDRTLWLLRGDGMDLDIDGAATVLSQPGACVRFPGEAKVSARLRAGPTEDLNLMVDRARLQADARLVDLPAAGSLAVPLPMHGSALLYLCDGRVQANAPGHDLTLLDGDALLVDEVAAPVAWQLVAPRAARALVATFTPR